MQRGAQRSPVDPDSDRRFDLQHYMHRAGVFGKIRDFDLGPIRSLVRALPEIGTALKVADIGCGDGSYSLRLVQEAERVRGDAALSLVGVDRTPAMLSAAAKTLGSKHRGLVLGDSAVLPFRKASLHVVTSFNCIHLFDIGAALAEIARVLIPGGRFFIYTRFQDQNRRTLWGQYFPRFADVEWRLFDEERLLEEIRAVPGLRPQRVETFSFQRTSSRQELLARTRERHYSTLALYDEDDFERAMSVFADRLSRLSDPVLHRAENSLVITERA